MFAYFIWALLLFSASQPQWLGNAVVLPQEGRNLLLALDVSGSMQIPDMKLRGVAVDRLTVTKSVANTFVEKRIGDRLGLILFGTKAYLQTPLTFDRKTIRHRLDDATIGLAGQRTAIGDAIGLAVKRLLQTPKDSRVLILLTDGANNAGALTPRQAAKIAADNHIKIYTIGLGSESMMIDGLLGPQMINPSNELDEETLKQIAKSTNGHYFRAQNTRELQQIYKTIDRLEPVNSDTTVFRPTTPLFYWPLLLALLLSFFLAIKRFNFLRKTHRAVQ